MDAIGIGEQILANEPQPWTREQAEKMKCLDAWHHEQALKGQAWHNTPANDYDPHQLQARVAKLEIRERVGMVFDWIIIAAFAILCGVVVSKL